MKFNLSILLRWIQTFILKNSLDFWNDLKVTIKNSAISTQQKSCKSFLKNRLKSFIVLHCRYGISFKSPQFKTSKLESNFHFVLEKNCKGQKSDLIFLKKFSEAASARLTLLGLDKVGLETEKVFKNRNFEPKIWCEKKPSREKHAHLVFRNINRKY